MKKIMTALVIAAITFGFAGYSLAADMDSILKGIQQRYGNAVDLKADFKQETFVKTLGRKQVKLGTVMFKQPDKMRWDYSSPDKQRLLTDGNTLWVYQPEEKVVYMRKLDAINSAKIPMQILAGKIDIKTQFKASLGTKEGKLLILELRPVVEGSGYEKTVLHIEEGSYNISRIDIVDLYGNITTLLLSNVNFNNKFKDSIFVYSPIPSVRVESPPVIEWD